MRGHPVIDACGIEKSGANFYVRWLMDRPPEPVIGPAIGRTRWRTMTIESCANYLILAPMGLDPRIQSVLHKQAVDGAGMKPDNSCAYDNPENAA